LGNQLDGDGKYLLYAGPGRSPIGMFPSVSKAMQAADEIVAAIWKHNGAI
jgi:hypothetical protein